MDSEILYREKYLKYKQKYLNLRDQIGGIVYKPGTYVFFFNSSILGASTPLLNNIEAHGSIPKPDINKLTDEIGNHRGWYYFKNITGPSKELKIIESSLKVMSKTASAVATKTGSVVSSGITTAKSVASSGASAVYQKGKQAVASAKEAYNTHKANVAEKERLALCEKCKKVNCEMIGGSELCLELVGGQTPIKLDAGLLDLVKKSKTLSEDNIVTGLLALLEEGAYDRALICEIGITSSKIIKYWKA